MTSPSTAWVRDRFTPALSWGVPERLSALPIAARPERALKPVGQGGASIESQVCATVGENLKRLRKQHRLSLEQLSTHSGVSRAMLSQVEQGKSVPSIRTLWQVAQALGVSVSWFLEPTHDDSVLLLQPPEVSPAQLEAEAAELRPLQRQREGHLQAFHELRLAPGARFDLPAITATRRVNVAVASGVLDVVLHGKRHLVRPREALQYESVEPLIWHNGGQVQVQAFVLIRTRNAAEALG
jgi:transcriptional regulator with XRE-family HTH domain